MSIVQRFFRRCHFMPRHYKIPCYHFQTLYYEKLHPIFYVNDPPHCQKGAVRSLRSSARTFRSSGLAVNPATLLLGGCPPRSYTGYDGQSDLEAAWLLNAKCVVSTWDSLGCLLFAMKLGLCTGTWISSEAFNPKQCLFNALCGFLALHVETPSVHGNRLQSEMLQMHIFTKISRSDMS